MKTPLPKDNATIVAGVSTEYLPKAENVSFSAVSNEGNTLHGYVNKTYGRISLISHTDLDRYITASFSYRTA